MSIHVNLNHLTHYRYDQPVALGPHLVRLRPAPHCRTPILAFSLKVLPANHFINWQQDPFGNYVARLLFPEKSAELSFEVDLIADLTVINPFDFFHEQSAEYFPFRYDEQLAHQLIPYLDIQERGPLLSRWLADVDRSRRPTNDFLVDLNRRLQKCIGYVIRMEPGVQSPDETLEIGAGSCRDSGWLLVQILRHLGLAARFVSGYLIQLKPVLVARDAPAGTDRDFADLHAWAEVYIPGAGWIGLDPTSGLLTGESHLLLAAAPHYRNAAPITGAASFANVDFSFDTRVMRVAEQTHEPRPAGGRDDGKPGGADLAAVERQRSV